MLIIMPLSATKTVTSPGKVRFTELFDILRYGGAVALTKSCMGKLGYFSYNCKNKNGSKG